MRIFLDVVTVKTHIKKKIMHTLNKLFGIRLLTGNTNKKKTGLYKIRSKLFHPR